MCILKIIYFEMCEHTIYVRAASNNAHCKGKCTIDAPGKVQPKTTDWDQFQCPPCSAIADAKAIFKVQAPWPAFTQEQRVSINNFIERTANKWYAKEPPTYCFETSAPWRRLIRRTIPMFKELLKTLPPTIVKEWKHYDLLCYEHELMNAMDSDVDDDQDLVKALESDADGDIPSTDEETKIAKK